MMAFPPFIQDDSVVSGTVINHSNGDLEVNGGTHTIDMNGPYQHVGNITVKGGGILTIRDTVFYFLTSDYERNIWIQDGAELYMFNSTFSVNLDAFNFTEGLNIEVKNNGDLRMVNSRLECDGKLNVDDGYVHLSNSVITKNKNDRGNYDTCVDITLINSGYMLITDSDIENLPPKQYINVTDTSTFVAINSFIDIDFGDTSYSRLRLWDSAEAYLYGVTTTEPTSFPPAASAIEIKGNAFAEIYKWMRSSVLDAAGVIIGGAKVTTWSLILNQPVEPPRIEIYNYTYKSSSNWNVTGYDGETLFPLRTNILKAGASFPNNNFTGNYNVKCTLESFKGVASAHLSFSSYPRLLESENEVRLNLTFDTIVPPDLNNIFSKKPPVYITGNTEIKKPVQIQENIIVDGGTLNLNSTTMNFAQRPLDRFYVLVKNGGTIKFADSNIFDSNGLIYYIYNFESKIDIIDSNIYNLGVMITADGGDINIENTYYEGNFYLREYNSNITISDNSILNGSYMIMDYANITMLDSYVSSMTLSLDDVMISAINTSFSNPSGLQFSDDTVAELINVNTTRITASGNAIAYVGWWLKTNVTDSGWNPVPGAIVDVYNYSKPSGDLIMYANGTSDDNGQVVTKVIGAIINASGTFFGIERSYFVQASYKGVKSSFEGFSSPSKNIKKFLTFSQKPDLKPTKIEIIGDAIEGRTVKLKAVISNIGDFEVNNVPVKFILNNDEVGSDTIDYIADGSSDSVQVDWEAKLGKQTGVVIQSRWIGKQNLANIH
jgi:hypothetical protein